jgi:hypothetical protein
MTFREYLNEAKVKWDDVASGLLAMGHDANFISDTRKNSGQIKNNDSIVDWKHVEELLGLMGYRAIDISTLKKKMK